METQELKIYSDGGSRGNPGPAASAFVVIKNGELIHKENKFLGVKTNNFAEYTAVLMSMEWLVKNNNKTTVSVLHYVDSELVANQLSGKYKIKSKNLIPLVSKIIFLLNNYKGKVKYIPVRRVKNVLSDALVNEALDEN
jgi:ribonuclease HI